MGQIESEGFLKGKEGNKRVRQNVRMEAEVRMIRLFESGTKQGM